MCSQSGHPSPVAEAHDPVVVRKQMGLRPATLLHRLDGLPAPGPWRRDGPARYRASRGSLSIVITVQARPDRCLGRLRLPVCDVTLSFQGLDSGARSAFLEAFERRFQRGGG